MSKFGIIGGGIHGAHLAISLIEAGFASPEEIKIIDPWSKLLSNWQCLTDRVGMQHLRSPSVHNLAADPMALKKSFRRKKRNLKPSLFASPYSRPSLELFNRHCEKLIDDMHLKKSHVRDAAEKVQPNEEQVHVTTTSGNHFTFDHLILAIGSGINRLNIPSWARDFVSSKLFSVQHIFSPSFVDPVASQERIVIVGGGMTATQYAIKCAEKGNQVTLVVREKIRVHQFDSDPCWLGPKCLSSYEKVRDVETRRKMIIQARQLGSVNPQVKARLGYLVDTGKIKLRIEHPEELDIKENSLRLVTLSQSYQADHLVLATGFKKDRPGGEMIAQLVAENHLPIAKCGYPVVNHHLQWDKRVFVTGALADLEIGPAARNISGARMACQRILGYFSRA